MSCGLPNLPGLTGQWDCPQPRLLALDVTDWILVASPDPSRWYIGFTVPSGGTGYVAPYHPDTADAGFIVPNFGNVTFAYKDWGVLIQGEWWSFGRGINTNIQVATASIRLRGVCATTED